MNSPKKVAATLAAITLATIALSGVTPQSASAQGTTLPPVLGHPLRGGERHPELRRALRNLEQAKNNLQQAKHDFAGHREQALDLVQRAIVQCQQALQSDKQ